MLLNNAISKNKDYEIFKKPFLKYFDSLYKDLHSKINLLKFYQEINTSIMILLKFACSDRHLQAHLAIH